MSCWVAGDYVSHLACCATVRVGFQSVRVSSPLYRGHTLKWSRVSSSVWPQMHLVYPAGTWMERRAYHRWYRVRRGTCSRASWSRGFCRCAGRLFALNGAFCGWPRRMGVLGGYPGAGRSSRGGCGRSLRGVGGVRCSLGGLVWLPAAGWVWGSGTACLDLCTACPRVSIGGAVWPRVSGGGAAGGCFVGCPVVRVRALGAGWCSGVWPACLRVHCRMRSGVTPV